MGLDGCATTPFWIADDGGFRETFFDGFGDELCPFEVVAVRYGDDTFGVGDGGGDEIGKFIEET